ncbi:MAG TPA: pilus assembly protein TadG-related protein [Parvibaculum sp.]|jgi:uncharacterized membrane protein
MTGCIAEGKARLAGLTRRFIADDHGVISVMAAFSLVLVLGIAAIVVDAGALLLTRRSLQNATDAAALSAVQHLDDPASAVTEVLTANGYNGDEIELIETGVYTADESKTTEGRFTAPQDGQVPNAVRVTLNKTAATYFASALGLSSFNTVHTRATAAAIATASFSAGTRLAQLNGGVANQLLGGLLGGNLSLSLIDYQALASTKVTALSFLDALAAQANVTAGNYGDLLNTQVTVGEILGAGISVLQDSQSGATGDISGATSALNTLLAQLPSGTALKLGDMLSAPSIEARTIGSIGKGEDGSQFELYSLVAAAARTAGTGKKVDVGTGLSIPITNTSLQASVAVGAPMAQVANGPVGTSVHTAQTRISLNLQLLNISIPLLLSTTINVPIYIEVAPGTATIEAIPCKSEQMVTLKGLTGAVTARYGDVTSGFSSFSAAPAVSNPSIVDIKVLLVDLPITASGSASLANNAPGADVDFSQADIDNGVYRSVDGSSDPSQLFPDLSDSLRLTVAGGTIPGTLTSLISHAVAVLGTPASTLLTTLGVQLGVMDMSVSGAKCGVPVLVG